MAALTTSVSQAHDANYCEGGSDYDHYIEDITSGPPGDYLLYAESEHDHLVVKNGDGTSNISIAQSPNDFNYLGHAVSLPEDHSVFKITYTTNKTNAVLKICFEEGLGLWYPIDSDGNIQPHVNNTPETRNLPIPRQDVEITGNAQTVNLGDYFTDPDNDNLTYTAVSSDTAKATTSVSGSTLTITPVATGVTTVTVTASDSTDSADTSFKVIVYRQPPLRTDTEMSGIVDPNAETP